MRPESAIPGFDRLDELVDLGSVGADVLDRRGAGEPGYEGEVLETREPAGERPVDQRIPAVRRVRAHERGPAVVRDNADAVRSLAQHHSRKVADEQQVAALADAHQRQTRDLRRRERCRQRIRLVHREQPCRCGLHAEGVQCAHGRIRLQRETSAHAASLPPFAAIRHHPARRDRQRHIGHNWAVAHRIGVRIKYSRLRPL